MSLKGYISATDSHVEFFQSGHTQDTERVLVPGVPTEGEVQTLGYLVPYHIPR